LAENKELIEYREKQKSDWIEEESFIKKLYTAFSDSEVFQFYMEKEDFSYAADRELIRKLYKTYICNNEDFDDFLEDHSLYWNDDKEIVDSFVLKTIKRFQEGSTEEQPLLPEFASDDDRQYALTLFRTTLEQGEEMRQLIKENCKNWEFKRLAFMDVIITQIALTEILTFPSIPLGVTFNEYLDIAKFYSTPRSSSYINGLLNGIVRTLKENGTIMK
jgi:N utilization substance protein B